MTRLRSSPRRFFQALALLAGALCLSGCLQTQNRKVVLEDELIKERVIKAAKNSQKKTYRQLLEEEMSERKRLTVYERQFRALQRRSDDLRVINGILDENPEDPFEAHDNEINRVMQRRWTDIDGPPKN